MINFLEETIKIIESHGKFVTDVKFVGYKPTNWFEPDCNICIDWEYFANIANFEYDNGFGGEEIPLGLVVVGADWWLERHEYDGSEWWEFKIMPNHNDYCYDIDFGRVLKRNI